MPIRPQLCSDLQVCLPGRAARLGFECVNSFSHKVMAMKICTIIGVRPQFVKTAVLSPIIRKEHMEILIHTGQHYDANMSAVFFQELGLPKLNYTLKPSDSASAEMENIPILADKLHLSNVDWLICNTGSKGIDNMVHQLISIIQREKANVVLIYGDTNSIMCS